MRRIQGLVTRPPNAAVVDFQKYATAAVGSGRYIYDRFVPQFENILKDQNPQYATPHVAFTNSSTAAHELLFGALEHHDTCLFQANCFPSVVFAAERAGIIPYFCDVKPNGEIDVEHAIRLIKQHNIKLLHVTDIGGGIPSNFLELQLIGQTGVTIINDCAHSYGATRGVSEMTPWADFKIYSFSPTKPMTCITGGAVIGNHNDLIEEVAIRARYGREDRFGNGAFSRAGHSCLFSEINAAMGVAMSNHYDVMRTTRHQTAVEYRVWLLDIPWVKEFDQGASSWYKFPVVLDDHIATNKLVQHLSEHGINLSSQAYSEPAFVSCAAAGLSLEQGPISDLAAECPGAMMWCRQHLCLPMHNYLQPGDVPYIAETIKAFGA